MKSSLIDSIVQVLQLNLIIINISANYEDPSLDHSLRPVLHTTA